MGSGAVVTEAILTVTAVIVASAFTLTILSSFSSLDSGYQSVVDSANERLLTDIKVIFAVNTTEGARIWVKNIGVMEVTSDLISKSDLFFGPVGECKRIRFDGDTTPRWEYELCNDCDGDGNWDSGETLEITVYWGSSLSEGDYNVEFSLYNGVSDEYRFSV